MLIGVLIRVQGSERIAQQTLREGRGNMSETVNSSYLITVGVALVGWLVVHRFSAWRDRVNHKRKMQTDFLVRAFQSLANSANRPFSPGAEHLKDMENALADIQLFGSKSQVQMVENFAEEFAQSNSASLDPLLNSLRKDLRDELGYDHIKGNVKWVRFEGAPTAAQPSVSPDVPAAASCRQGHG